MSILTNSTGAEELQLAAYKTILGSVNEYIAEQESLGHAIDAQLKTINPEILLDTATLERIEPAFVHYGHRPSLIEAPVDEWPAISVMTYVVGPSATNSSADYGYSLQIRMAIECIVKSGPYASDDREGEGEDLVGRRIKRTAEAIQKLMQDNRELGGAFLPPEQPPSIAFGDLFARDEHDGRGGRFYWQGVRMEFTYLNQTVFTT